MCIYLIRNDINNLIYIGKTTNMKRRYKEYKYGSRKINKRRNYKIMQEINKYGFENFTFTILEEIFNNSLLNEREEFWINELNSRDSNIGYNSKTGGIGGILTEESKEKMSISSRSFKHTEEEKLRRSKEIVVLDIYTDKIAIYQSAKVFSEKLNKYRSEITKAIRKGLNLKCRYYIFYNDYDLAKLTLETIINRRTINKSNSRLSLYIDAFNKVFGNVSVETNETT